jgi:hypothetical protein
VSSAELWVVRAIELSIRYGGYIQLEKRQLLKAEHYVLATAHLEVLTSIDGGWGIRPAQIVEDAWGNKSLANTGEYTYPSAVKACREVIKQTNVRLQPMLTTEVIRKVEQAEAEIAALLAIAP